MDWRWMLSFAFYVVVHSPTEKCDADHVRMLCVMSHGFDKSVDLFVCFSVFGWCATSGPSHFSTGPRHRFEKAGYRWCTLMAWVSVKFNFGGCLRLLWYKCEVPWFLNFWNAGTHKGHWACFQGNNDSTLLGLSSTPSPPNNSSRQVNYSAQIKSMIDTYLGQLRISQECLY